jgi:mannose-6-phosphate isomerase-like protein (cupin superfamily)
MSIATVQPARTRSAAEPVAPDIAELVALARTYAEDPAGWPIRPRFESSRRWYARLAEASGHEAWLLTWLPGQETDLHDHGGSAGAFVVVSGGLTEATVEPATNRNGYRRVRQSLAAGTVRAFGPNHIHQIRNVGPAPAISVHVYAPALHSMTKYRFVGRRIVVEAISSAGKDW